MGMGQVKCSGLSIIGLICRLFVKSNQRRRVALGMGGKQQRVEVRHSAALDLARWPSI